MRWRRLRVHAARLAVALAFGLVCALAAARRARPPSECPDTALTRVPLDARPAGRGE